MAGTATLMNPDLATRTVVTTESNASSAVDPRWAGVGAPPCDAVPKGEHGEAGLHIGARNDSANVQWKPAPYRVDDLGDGGACEILSALVHVSLVAIECIFDPDAQFGSVHHPSVRSMERRAGHASANFGAEGRWGTALTLARARASSAIAAAATIST